MNNNILQKNPFSLYDFLGYLFPGAFFLMALYVIFNRTNELGIPQINLGQSVCFVVVSYIMGHVLSYLSSITVERFSLWMFGYPSEFLMSQKTNCGYWNRVVTNCGSNYYACPQCGLLLNSIELRDLVLRFIIGVFHLPILLCYMPCSLFSLKRFIVKPLDDVTQGWINDKIQILVERLGFENTEEDVDYSRLIYHYYAKSSSLFLMKVDNYVALYGFLRATCLTFNLLTIIITVIMIAEGNLFRIPSILFICAIAIITFVLFLAFMKFYRRYSLEIFMFLISDADLVEHRHKSNLPMKKGKQVLSTQVKPMDNNSHCL